MAEIVQVTQQDIDGLAAKLDQFATVLTERERTVLFGVFGMAGKSIEEIVRSTQTGGPALGGGGAPPALSRQFQTAFENGVGTKFQVQAPGEAEAVKGSVKGSVGVDWAK